MHGVNLNELKIACADGVSGAAMSDPAVTVSRCEVAVHFRNVTEAAEAFIRSHDYVVGCVAWLTSPRLLRALASRKGVSVVVQKEDFLRPDCDARSGWAARLRSLYESLPVLGERHQVAGLVASLSRCGDPTIEAVRCCGSHNSDRSPAHPRCHHKFLVGCRWPEDGDLTPEAVWTGSFNFTLNSARSLENAVEIRSAEVASAFYFEWSQVVALSEPLDWHHDWAEPEWRVGT